MYKLVALTGGVLAAGSIALIGATVAESAPSSASLNVVGEQFNKAKVILKSEGVKAFPGVTNGDKLPQEQCLVSAQRVTSKGRMFLDLDCTEAAKEQLAENSNSSGGTTVGSNGITTIHPNYTTLTPPPAAPPAPAG